MSDLPKGWEEKRLGEIVEIVNGGTPSTGNEDYWNGNISWITPKDLSNFEGRYISKGEKSITKEGLKNSSAKILPKNTILFSSRAPIGYVAIAKQEVSTNQGFKNIICDEVETHYLYMYYWLHNNAKQIEKLSSGSTFSEASTSLMKSLKITIPKIDEQKQIANILSSFDKKIELLKEQNQTLETMAQTIFKEWFVDFNYPNITGEMIDSEMGEIPKGWEIIQINNLFDVRDGTHDSPKQTLNGKYLITSKHILNFKLDMENAYLISEEDFFNINKRSLVEENDILFSMIGTIGLTYLEQSSNINYAIKNVALFKTSQNIEWVYYMYIWLSGEKGQDFIVKHKTGSTQQYISLSSLRNIKIIKPSSEILIYFNDFVRPIFNKIKINTSQIQILEETRDSLLPKLMSGKIRVFEYDN